MTDDIASYPFGSPVTLEYDFLDEDGAPADPPLNASTQIFYKPGDDGEIVEKPITDLEHVDEGVFLLRLHANVEGRWWYAGRSADGSSGARERYFVVEPTEFPETP